MERKHEPMQYEGLVLTIKPRYEDWTCEELL